MKNNRSAFSLIELSIVVLIIGILVAGVTQSTRILSQARLNTARTLTQSSPVNSISNLALWIESTSEESFTEAESDNGAEVITWYDINPQAVTKANFVGTTGTSGFYTTGAMNNLPAVLFNGTDEFMTSANFDNIGADTTMFLVVNRTAVSAAETILAKTETTVTNGTNFVVRGSSDGDWEFCDTLTSDSSQNCFTTDGAGANADTNYLVTVLYEGNTSGGVIVGQNGTTVSVSDDTTSSAPVANTTSLVLGASSVSTKDQFFGGYVGEIIIFDRKLKAEEVNSVNDYLAKKWGITLSNS